jgi:hypothetical protein
MNTTVIILLILFMLFALYLAFRASLFLSRRAICSVISTLRRRGAVKVERAVTLDDLGISPWAQFFSVWRDYRPWAFQTLIQAGIIRSATTGFFYLSEDELDKTSFESSCPII